MYDRGLSVLEQYGLVSENTYRGRGALICQTQQGLKLIKSFQGSTRRLETQNELLLHLKEAGHPSPDLVLRNQEGELVTTDREGVPYVVKDWREGKECDPKSREEVLRGMEQLAFLHQDLFLTPKADYRKSSLIEEYRKHNQELKKIRTYIRTRQQKADFEYLYLNSVERYFSYATEALERLQQSDYTNQYERAFLKGTICHGEYNQHNIMLNGDNIWTVNYDHFFFEEHTADVAQFLRKILEKHNWNLELGYQMIEAYGRRKTISDVEWNLLGIRLSYPEKFWKIANFYYNNNKAFLSARHLDKLRQQLAQEKQWLNFVKSLFSNFLLRTNSI